MVKYFLGDEISAIVDDIPIRAYVLGEYGDLVHCMPHLPVKGSGYPYIIKVNHKQIVKSFKEVMHE